MKSRRFICLILILSFVFVGLFSISASAAGAGGFDSSDYTVSFDGMTCYTMYSTNGSTYNPFSDSFSINEYSEDLYVLVVLDFANVVNRGTFFDLSFSFNASSYVSVAVDEAEFSAASSSVVTNVSTVNYGGELSGNTINYYDLVFDHNVASATIKLKLTDLSYVSSNQYNYNFSVTSATSTEIDEGTISSRILRALKSVWYSILNLPETLWFHFENGFKALFIPSESDIIELRDKFEALLDDRFGAVYDSSQIIDDFANTFVSQSQSALIDGEGADGTVSFPAVTVNLAGTDFTFGGYEVQLIPDKFEGIVESLKFITNISCFLLLLNTLRRRFDVEVIR